MFKFLYTSDIHYGIQPLSRSDDYNAAILNKIEFLLKAAEDKGCPVFIGGDVFDSPKLKMFEILKLKRVIEKFPRVELYILRGNDSHDGHPDNSPLEFLEMLSNVSIFPDKYNTITLSDKMNIKFLFASHGDDNLALEKDIDKVSNINILLTHDTITSNPVMFDHTLINDFKTECDVVLLAHYHPYQGTIRRNDGVLFVGPGAMCRRKRIKHDMERTPMYAEITLSFTKDLNKHIEVDQHELPHDKNVWTSKSFSAISSDDIDVEILKSIEEIKRATTESTLTSASLEDLLKSYAKTLGISEGLLNFILCQVWGERT